MVNTVVVSLLVSIWKHFNKCYIPHLRVLVQTVKQDGAKKIMANSDSLRQKPSLLYNWSTVRPAGAGLKFHSESHYLETPQPGSGHQHLTAPVFSATAAIKMCPSNISVFQSLLVVCFFVNSGSVQSCEHLLHVHLKKPLFCSFFLSLLGFATVNHHLPFEWLKPGRFSIYWPKQLRYYLPPALQAELEECETSLLALAVLPLVNPGDSTTSSSPAPGLEGIAGSLVQVSLHGDAIRCISVEVHDGVIVGHVLGWNNTETGTWIIHWQTLNCFVHCNSTVPSWGVCGFTFFFMAACLCSMSLFSRAESRTNWVCCEDFTEKLFSSIGADFSQHFCFLTHQALCNASGGV